MSSTFDPLDYRGTFQWYNIRTGIDPFEFVPAADDEIETIGNVGGYRLLKIDVTKYGYKETKILYGILDLLHDPISNFRALGFAEDLRIPTPVSKKDIRDYIIAYDKLIS